MFIGVTGYNHESSAALVDRNGVLIDFCREESLSRIKGDKSFPRRSINKLLDTEQLILKPAQKSDFDFEKFKEAWEAFEAART